MSFEFWLLYSTTVFLASIVPGPSMLLALTHGMKYGARRTMATALGNVTASLIQAAISIAGLGAILTASESAFLIVRWTGAAYLIFLGTTTWRSSEADIAIECNTPSSAPQVPLHKMFLQAFLVAAGNPKAIVFFTALFPQFIDTDAEPVARFCTLMGTLAIIAFGCFMIYAISGQKIISVFSRKRIGKYFNKVIGGTFISAGIGLAASER